MQVTFLGDIHGLQGSDVTLTITSNGTAVSGEMVIEGIKCNIPLQQDLFNDAGFQAGSVNIHYLEKKLEEKNK